MRRLAEADSARPCLPCAAARRRKSRREALTALFLEECSSQYLGLGMNAVLSDTELRRYRSPQRTAPLRAHLTGIWTPPGFLFLCHATRVAIGLYVMGRKLWFGFIAVLLLFAQYCGPCVIVSHRIS